MFAVHSCRLQQFISTDEREAVRLFPYESKKRFSKSTYREDGVNGLYAFRQVPGEEGFCHNVSCGNLLPRSTLMGDQ